MNSIQKLAITFYSMTIGITSASAAPPESVSQLVLGTSVQEIKAKYGSRLKLWARWDEDLADSRCGMDKYELDIPEFQEERLYFFKGKLFAIEMSMKTSMSVSEMYALARRFIAKYGSPTQILCSFSDEPVIERYSVSQCESKPSIHLSYESGPKGSEERHEFWIGIYSEADTLSRQRGYTITLQRGRAYYNETIRSCSKEALRTINEERARRITLPD